MNGTGTQAARQFLDAVAAACADLAPADRARLVDGLEEHLAELSSDGVDLVAELGDPVAYAAELRSAAGLPPAATGAGQAVPAAGIVPGPPMPDATRSGPSAGKVLLVVGAVLAGIAVLVTAAVVLGGVLLFTTSSSNSGPVPAATVSEEPVTSIAVPDVTGVTAAQARAVLAQIGLAVEERSEPSSSVERGTVLRQDPAAGAAVAVGSTVTLDVSSGG